MCGPRWNRYTTPSIASHLLLICGACLCLLCECGVSNVVVCVNLGRAKCARRWRWRWWWHIGRGKNIFPIMKRKFDRRCDAIRTRNWNKMKKIAFVTMDTCSIYLTIHCFFLSNGDGGGCVMVVWHVCTVYIYRVYLWRWWRRWCNWWKSIPLAWTEFQIAFHCKCDLDCCIANYSPTPPPPPKKTFQLLKSCLSFFLQLKCCALPLWLAKSLLKY